MTFAIFHDFPGLENGLPKFHGRVMIDDTLLKDILEGRTDGKKQIGRP